MRRRAKADPTFAARRHAYIQADPTYAGRHSGGRGYHPVDPYHTGPAPQHPDGKPRGPKAPKGVKKGPFDLTAPLTRKSFNHELKAAERLQFNPLQRQLNSEQAAQNQRITDVGNWYQDYQNKLATLRGEAQQGYTNATNTVQQAGVQAQAQDSASRSAIMEALRKDAAQRGTNVDPNLDVTSANAEAARANTRNTSLGTIATIGANQNAYLANRQGIAAQAGIEGRMAEIRRLQGVLSDQRELAQKRGDFRTQYRADARESERKYGLSQQTLAGENWRAKLSAATQRRGQNLTQQNNREDNAATARQKRKDRRHDSIQSQKDRQNKNYRDTHEPKGKKNKGK